MPKQVTLHNQHIAVEKGTELDSQVSPDDEPVVKEVWTLVFSDRTYHDQIRITFGKEARDQVIKDLMGGIVLPGI
jgi:hypothetical protein